MGTLGEEQPGPVLRSPGAQYYEQEGRSEGRRDTQELRWESLRRHYTGHPVFSFDRAQNAQTCTNHICPV